MTIHHLPSDNEALRPPSATLTGAGSVKPTSARKDSAQRPAPQGKDDSDVSQLSRLMAKTAQDLNQDLEIRPAKVALARTLLEKGPLSDQDIDATWNKMLPFV
jgi:hypothetical protein